jgi:hypothetical protein
VTCNACLVIVPEGDCLFDFLATLGIDAVRVPPDAPDAETRIRQHLADRRVHAAMTLLDAASLSSQALGRGVALCAHEADARDDFRLFVVLKGIGPDDVKAASVKEISNLQEIVQFVALDAIDAMKTDLGIYLGNLSRIVSAARVRWLKVHVAFLAGRVGAALQLLGTAIVVVLWAALQRYQPEDIVYRLGSLVAPVAMIAQFPFFVSLALPVYGLLQPRGMRPKDLARSACAMVILWCCLAVAESLEADQAWAMTGQTLGLILDFIRRRGGYAQWRRLTLRAIEYTKEGALTETLQATVDDFVVDPLTCPLLSESIPRVFISYTTKSDWSAERALLLARRLLDAGTTIFLDRMFIDKGMNWHRELRRRISDSNVFVSLTDEVTMGREFTARELETALRGRALTGTPYTLLLRRKGAVVNAESLPAFRAVLDGPVQLPGRLEVIDWNEKAGAESVTWMLRDGHFSGAAVLPLWLSRPLHFVGGVLTSVAGTTGWLVGIVLLVMLLAGFAMPRTHGFSVMLASSAWLGFTFRIALAWAWELRPARRSTAWVHAVACLGFLAACATLWPDASNVTRAWAGLSMLSGWLLATWLVEIQLVRSHSLPSIAENGLDHLRGLVRLG